jgi:hypothetical protein
MPRISRLLDQGPTLSFEFFPPKTAAAHPPARRAADRLQTAAEDEALDRGTIWKPVRPQVDEPAVRTGDLRERPGEPRLWRDVQDARRRPEQRAIVDDQLDQPRPFERTATGAVDADPAADVAERIAAAEVAPRRHRCSAWATSEEAHLV